MAFSTRGSLFEDLPGVCKHWVLMRLFLFSIWLLGVIPIAGALEIDALTFNIRYDNPRDGKDAWPKRQEMVGQWLQGQAPDDYFAFGPNVHRLT